MSTLENGCDKLCESEEGAGGSKLLLHVGCGVRNPAKLPSLYRSSEWREVRLDIDGGVHPDVVADIRDMDCVHSDSVDAVYSSHNLEHLYSYEVPLALGEFFRILKPGGHALVACPDIQSVASYVAQSQLMDPVYMSPLGPITPLDILYGHGSSLAGGNHFMAHHTGFTAQSLTQLMAESGFVNLRGRRRGKPHFDIWIMGIKNVSV